MSEARSNLLTLSQTPETTISAWLSSKQESTSEQILTHASKRVIFHIKNVFNINPQINRIEPLTDAAYEGLREFFYLSKSYTKKVVDIVKESIKSGSLGDTLYLPVQLIEDALSLAYEKAIKLAHTIDSQIKSAFFLIFPELSGPSENTDEKTGLMVKELIEKFKGNLTDVSDSLGFAISNQDEKHVISLVFSEDSDEKILPVCTLSYFIEINRESIPEEECAKFSFLHYPSSLGRILIEREGRSYQRISVLNIGSGDPSACLNPKLLESVLPLTLDWKIL